MTTYLLLRGLTRESSHWGAFPQALAAASGAEVLCVDLPGNGSLCRERSPLTVEAMAEYCHAQMLARAIPGPCHVVAMSLGAMVVVAWAQRYPQDIASAVLISTSLRPFSPIYRRLRPANYARILGLLLRRPAPAVIEAAVLDMTSTLAAQSSRRSAIVLDWCQCRLARPVSALNTLRQLFAAARFRAPPLSPIRHLLLLAGRGDRLVDSRCSEQLAAAWGVPLICHPKAGHDLPLDDGAWVIEQLLEWARREASSQSS